MFSQKSLTTYRQCGNLEFDIRATPTIFANTLNIRSSVERSGVFVSSVDPFFIKSFSISQRQGSKRKVPLKIMSDFKTLSFITSSLRFVQCKIRQFLKPPVSNNKNYFSSQFKKGSSDVQFKSLKFVFIFDTCPLVFLS